MKLLPDAIVEKRFLKTLEGIKKGSLTLIAPDGRVHSFQGKQPGPSGQWHIHDWVVIKNAMMRGDIALGEDYIAGLWDTNDIEALFSVLIMNLDELDDYAHGDMLRRAWFLLYNRVICRNSRQGSRQNIKAHYDVGNEFYSLWLDETMTYSSALYSTPATPLPDAQRAKYGRILDKIGDADNLLEVGCGWGGFAAEAAAQGRSLTGVTVSAAQHHYATERLQGKADIRLQDYRDVQGKFDGIVSIEMFEAVGERYWSQYFRTLSERLKRGGKAVIQTITIADPFFTSYRSRSDFIRHYVFPGGMLPSVQRFEQEAAKAGLKTTDVFAFGQDYAQTLREWLARFEARKVDILALGYNEAFLRNWRFYMGICAAAFAVDRTNVVQVELAHA